MLVGNGAGYSQLDKLRATFGKDIDNFCNIDPVPAQLLNPTSLAPGLGDLIKVMVERYKAKTNANDVPPHCSMGFNQTWVLLNNVLPIAKEKCLGIIGDEGDESLAVLVGVNLAAENVLQIFVLEDRGCDRGRDPQDLLLCVDLGRERHRLSARVNAVHNVNLFLVDQPLDFIDGDVHLALTIGIDRDHLVLAGNAAALVDEIDSYLRAHCACRRTAGGEWTRQIIDNPDPSGFGLRRGEAS
jgi:hypothetical protein